MATDLPPTVEIDPHKGPLREYVRARLMQVLHDSYMGVPLAKFPEDLRVYEHLMWIDGPDTVIELGTYGGGSALWFRDRLAALRVYGRTQHTPLVVSVDIDQTLARDALTGPGMQDGVTLIETPLQDPQTIAQVAELVQGRRCFVVEDSAHTFESTTAALEAYAQFVPQGGFMVVEDGCVDDDELRLPMWPDDVRGVRPALDAWLTTREGQQFTVRRDLELYGVSCHPSGFLQRRG
jgi:cephalosporin hydroxylase